MRRLAVVCTLSVLPGACGGGGGGSAGAPPADLTTQELLEQCLAADLSDLSSLIATIQGLLDGDSGGPQPQFDLVTGLFTGVVPWTVDLDGDQVADLSGTVFLTDAQGNVSLPPLGVIALLGGGTTDLDAILALLPNGTNVNLSFEFNGLGLLGGAAGDGTFSVEVQDGLPAGVSGGGTFISGECSFDFSFDGLGPEILEGGGFGSGSVDFTLLAGEESVGGTIVLDGTNVARVTARRSGAPDETFLVDLTTGEVTPG